MAKTNPKKKTSNLTKYNRAGYFFVAPFVIVFLIFSVYPVFRTLVLSFTDSKQSRNDACHEKHRQIVKNVDILHHKRRHGNLTNGV